MAMAYKLCNDPGHPGPSTGCKHQKVIIPKGVLDPNENTVIEIPAGLQEGPIVITNKNKTLDLSFVDAVSCSPPYQFMLITAEDSFGPCRGKKNYTTFKVVPDCCGVPR